jgi:crotonobetainyl-CoA:carnitine CoA-transferase CaiB-like acyl-CoA transferase
MPVKLSECWTESSSESILHGIRIVDLSQLIAGPAAGAYLADLGAEVLKIEMPGKGDMMRGFKTLLGVQTGLPHGRQAFVEYFNRNKKSVTIDLHKEEGQQLFYKLIGKSDVFISNLLPSVLVDFKVDYPTLSKHNPKLVYVSTNVFGLKGPDADAPGFDIITQARSGLMTSAGDEGMPPISATDGVVDTLVGLLCAYGTLGALIARDRSGIGQEVQVSQLGGVIGTIIGIQLIQDLLIGARVGKRNSKKLNNPLFNWYKCKDDKWIVLNAVGDRGNWWHAICAAFGILEFEHDPRFETEPKRNINAQVLAEILERVMLTKSSEEWDAIIRDLGDPFPHSIAQDISDLKSDPQVLANDYIVDLDHPILGKIKFPAHPVSLSRTPATFRSIAPEVGQHTEEVLIDILGYDWDRIVELKDRNII